MGRGFQRDGARGPDSVVLRSVRTWQIAERLSGPVFLFLCLGVPIGFLWLDFVGPPAMLFLAAMSLFVWAILCIRWLPSLIAWLQTIVMRGNRRRLSLLASREPGVLRVHDWADEGPGAMALSDDRLWLCCTHTGFRPVVVSIGAIEALHVYSYTSPVMLGMMCRQAQDRKTLSIAIPFATGEVDARDWQSALRVFVTPSQRG